MVAAAAVWLYIADIWFKYAQGSNYQSGEVLKVFWVFSGVLCGMGAVLEDNPSSSRTPQERGRKRA
jgi:hypothetical protein